MWLVSGQSNAEMSFSWGILNGEAEMAKARDYPNIRQIKFSHAVSDFPIAGSPCNIGPWKVATEKTLPGITAEGYFMARELNAKTGIPIGILDDSWSGCRIEPFVCEEGLKAVPELANDYASAIKARVVFEHVGSGLFAGEKGPDTPGERPTATPDGKLRGFAVAGADKRWHWADAVIDGDDVVVSATEVPAPVAVRYAFRDNPMGDCNLYNREGLPASPFRTDSW